MASDGADASNGQKKDKRKETQKRTSPRKLHLMQASVLRRLLAFILDLAILNIFVLSPFNRLISRAAGNGSAMNIYQSILMDPELMASLTSIMVASTLVMLVYFIVLQRKLSQTLGMMLMGIYTIKIPMMQRQAGAARRRLSLEEAAELSKQFKLGFFDALLRNIFLIPFAPFIFLWILDPMFMLLNRNAQRLTEYLSQTMVVEMMGYDTSMYKASEKQRWI